MKNLRLLAMAFVAISSSVFAELSDEQQKELYLFVKAFDSGLADCIKGKSSGRAQSLITRAETRRR